MNERDDEFEAVFVDVPYVGLPKGVCRFNRNVDCDAVGNHCAHCGWNPAVAEIRAQKIREHLGLTKGKK